MNSEYQKICAQLLQELPQKQKAVIERRFGLNQTFKETLQKIGNSFGITRERVRQIEREALQELQQKASKETFKPILVVAAKTFKKSGGLKREDILLRELGQDKFQNEVKFILTLSDNFHFFPENEVVFSFWAKRPGLFEPVTNFLKETVKILKKENHPLSKDALLANALEISNPALLLSCLEVSREIEKGPLGVFGLAVWPEIKPKGVRDAALLTLRDYGEPLHFRSIAQKASELLGKCFYNREILPQTVHNELIRDKRFVLVGRGTYGLREWGYNDGTVREVILDILKEAKKPLAKTDILAKVKKQRLVEDNTILLNLSNKNYFLKNSQGGYIMKEV